MSLVMDDDDYWNSSDAKTKALNFDDDVSGKCLGHDKPERIETEETVPVTLKRLVLGRNCSLHAHRTLKSKTGLLDGAVAIGDGNAILTIYQFQHQVKMQGNNVDGLLKKITNTLTNYFDQPGIDVNQMKLVSAYIKLLEWQKCVNDPQLYNKSTLRCLAHCCANHWHEGAGKMMSPLTLCQQQQISLVQYDWVVLNVHAKLKNWDIVESLFTRKDWFGRSTLSSHIPLNVIITRLHDLKAGSTLLANFINRISSTDERLDIAKQLKIHSIVIETLAKQRDRSALTNYQMTLKPQSEEYVLAENTLRNPVSSNYDALFE
ncbi:Spermatogenesis-defective protein 39 homolog [Eumeta japonica]|uniref:Spermatogenesis-defective protein 39 homolog n=1 Tax=Eumeta variegata TaxID=151549 RepID=A0A4C1TSM4_EUMVA|nr:Spermatogenesis-defective protein 39 homolog [Eumeta japonica]